MKSLVLSLLLFHSLFSFDYKLQPKEVGGDSCHCFFGLSQAMDRHNNGNMSNSCFVNMGDSYIVIDSGPTFSYAKQAYEEMKQINNLPISYVFNTHVHDDHWLGNSYYKMLDTKIIGSSAFKNLPHVTMTRMQRRISPEAFKKTTQEFPTIFVEDELTLIIDNSKVYVKSINQKAHTNSDLYVYIPSKKIVFVGDLVFNDRVPSIRDGDLSGCLQALDEIKSLDVEYIVGGHGKIVSRHSVDMTYKYIQELKEKVSALIEEGKDIEDVVNLVIMAEFKSINLYDSMHRQNVEVAYRILEWQSE